jgi:lipopolysaccharide/colanic/teichoic acid biosynthesis glycosyltransferase
MKLYSYTEKLNYFKAFMDILIVSLSWILSFFLRFDMDIIEVTKGTDTLHNYIRLWPLLVLCYAFVFILTSTYKNTFKSPRIWDENLDLAKKHVVSFLIFVATAFFIYEHRYSRITMLFFFVMTLVLLPVGRSLVRKANRFYLKNTKFRKNAAIVGTGPSVEKIKNIILKRSDLNLISNHDMSLADLVFLIPNANEMLHANELYQKLGATLAEVFLVPYLGENVFFEPKPIQIDGVITITLNSSSMSPMGMAFKRLFDIFFSLLFILLFSPVFLICALLVKVTSSGPVLYKQERMGLDGKIFMCLKFRGMTENAEEKTGPVWAKADDDRTTAIGKWLRKTSLDEIPQFFNVLKGEMSVVGPRPERPIFVENFKTHIPGYMLRHKAKAGITGWAQISGWRGNTSLEKRIECDLWYIQNWSIWLDLKIVLLTPFKGFIHPNAY